MTLVVSLTTGFEREAYWLLQQWLASFQRISLMSLTFAFAGIWCIRAYSGRTWIFFSSTRWGGPETQSHWSTDRQGNSTQFSHWGLLRPWSKSATHF